MLLTVTLNASLDRAYQIPEFRPGRIFRVDGLRVTAGGKGNNVARVAAALGLPVTATGFAGGAVGASIVRRLQDQGIKTAFVEVAGESRQCLAVTSGKAVTEILEPGPMVSQGELQAFKQCFKQLCSKHRYVVLSGSLPLGVPPDIYADLIAIAHSCGCHTILDARGEPLRQGVRARPWMVKINRQEAEELFQCQLQDYRLAARILAEKSLGCINIVTLGSDGAVLWHDEQNQALRVSSPAVCVKNTVGSGDSFLAGFLYGWARTEDTATALRLAATCGAANAAQEATGSIDKAMLTELMQHVETEIM